MTSSEIFEKGTIVGQLRCRMEDQKPLPGLALNQNFATRRALKTKRKILKLGDVVLSKLVLHTRRSGGGNNWGLRAKPPAAGRFVVFFFLKKKAILMPLDHILHVFGAI